MIVLQLVQLLILFLMHLQMQSRMEGSFLHRAPPVILSRKNASVSVRILEWQVHVSEFLTLELVLRHLTHRLEIVLFVVAMVSQVVRFRHLHLIGCQGIFVLRLHLLHLVQE